MRSGLVVPGFACWFLEDMGLLVCVKVFLVSHDGPPIFMVGMANTQEDTMFPEACESLTYP